MEIAQRGKVKGKETDLIMSCVDRNADSIELDTNSITG